MAPLIYPAHDTIAIHKIWFVSGKDTVQLIALEESTLNLCLRRMGVKSRATGTHHPLSPSSHVAKLFQTFRNKFRRPWLQKQLPCDFSPQCCTEVGGFRMIVGGT